MKASTPLTLDGLSVGERAFVERIRGTLGVRYLADMGIHPGTEIEFVGTDPPDMSIVTIAGEDDEQPLHARIAGSVSVARVTKRVVRKRGDEY